MTLFEFLDLTFQKESLAQSTNYTMRRHGVLQGIHSIMKGLRALAKTYAIPELMVKFLLTKVGLLAEPVAPKITPPAPEAPAPQPAAVN